MISHQKFNNTQNMIFWSPLMQFLQETSFFQGRFEVCEPFFMQCPKSLGSFIMLEKNGTAQDFLKELDIFLDQCLSKKIPLYLRSSESVRLIVTPLLRIIHFAGYAPVNYFCKLDRFYTLLNLCDSQISYCVLGYDYNCIDHHSLRSLTAVQPSFLSVTPDQIPVFWIFYNLRFIKSQRPRIIKIVN